MPFAHGIRTGCRTVGLAVAVLAYVLFLQGFASAYAKTVMAIALADSGFVICAPSGKDYESPGDRPGLPGEDCCAALCKAASSSGPALEPVSGDFLSPIPPMAVREHVRPIENGLLADFAFIGGLGARAPPAFFI
ncbi:MAG: hypothetical protein KDK08_01870 [Rhizobiaceae bacterium]|nr:hypothetical protein [Rhizobiaceae bacterium]